MNQNVPPFDWQLQPSRVCDEASLRLMPRYQFTRVPVFKRYHDVLRTESPHRTIKYNTQKKTILHEVLLVLCGAHGCAALICSTHVVAVIFSAFAEERLPWTDTSLAPSPPGRLRIEPQRCTRHREWLR